MIEFEPIGTVRHEAKSVPRHWSVSEVEGRLVIEERYLAGIKDIRAGQKILVIFLFHESPPFTPARLAQKPPHRKEKIGVFSICSPVRPNPVGLSILEVLGVEDNAVRVKGIDMYDGTPILDIKPYISAVTECPSHDGQRSPDTP